MKKTQLISIVIIICLSIGNLIGCGNTTEVSQDTENAVVNSEAEASAPTQTVTDEESIDSELAPTASDSVVSESTTGWQVVNSFRLDFPAYKIAFLNPDLGLTGGASGEMHYFNTSGKTWPRAENDSACMFGVEIVDDKVAYACGNSCNVIKSADGGQTWARVADFGGSNPNQCRMLSFCDENTGWIAHESILASTADGGTTWNKLEAPAKIMCMKLTNSTTGCLVGMDRKLYITSDSGSTWDTKDITIEGFENSLPLSQSCAISLSDDGTGILFYLEKGGLLNCYETNDGAETWTNSATLDISADIESAYFVYLSKDAKTLTVQSNTGDEVAVLTNLE